MKTTKRFLAAMIAIASVMAVAPMSAFADDTVINQGSTDKTGGMVVSYTKSKVSPTFTITIPATVDLNSTTRTATITAENVYLDTTQHKQIDVTLDAATNTASGSTFHAKNSKGDSTATYTISKGTTAISVGDTVATFTEDGSQVLSFSEPTGATYAGKHTETLTFGISLEEAGPTLATALEDGATVVVDYDWNNFHTYFNFTNNNGTYTCSISGQYTSNFNGGSLTKSGNTLVFKADGADNSFNAYLGLTINFDTMNNTYSFTRKGSLYRGFAISVNGTDITSQLGAQ